MKYVLKNVLALDSIVGFLDFTERMQIHRFINRGETDTNKLSLRVRRAINSVKYHKWDAPEQKITSERTTVFYNTKAEKWQQIEKYKHPILTEIKTL